MAVDRDPFVVLRERYGGLSDGQQRIAKRILDDPHEAVLLSTDALGREVGVSDSTVVRFAGALGYEGFPELRLAIQRSLYQHLPPSRQFHETVRLDGSAIDDSIQADVGNLGQLLTETTRAALAKAVDVIARADKVFTVGFHSSFAPAYELAYVLGRIRAGVHCIGSGGSDMSQQAASIDAHSAVVAFSLPRYSRDTYLVAEHAMSVSAGLVVVTDSLISPLAQLGGIAICVSSRSASFFHSQVAALAVGNVIVAEIAKRDPTGSERQLVSNESINRHLEQFLIEPTQQDVATSTNGTSTRQPQEVRDRDGGGSSRGTR